MSWARTGLKRIGVIQNPKRGRWALTEKGREYLMGPRDKAEPLLKDEVAYFWDMKWFDEVQRQGLWVCGFSQGQHAAAKINFEATRIALAHPERAEEEILQDAYVAFDAKLGEILQTAGAAYVPAGSIRIDT